MIKFYENKTISSLTSSLRLGFLGQQSENLILVFQNLVYNYSHVQKVFGVAVCTGVLVDPLAEVWEEFCSVFVSMCKNDKIPDCCSKLKPL